MTEKREPIYTELLSHLTSLASVTDSQIASLKKDQIEVQKAIQELYNKLQEVAKQIHKYDIETDSKRINNICDRLESCWSRVQNVNKRADKLITTLQARSAQLTTDIEKETNTQ